MSIVSLIIGNFGKLTIQYIKQFYVRLSYFFIQICGTCIEASC